MSNETALHRLVVHLIGEDPQLALALAEIAGVEVPPHDALTRGSAVFPGKSRGSPAGDNLVVLDLKQKHQFFLEIELQRAYKREKVTRHRNPRGQGHLRRAGRPWPGHRGRPALQGYDGRVP